MFCCNVPVVSCVRDMQKELKLEDNDYTGAVFEGKYSRGVQGPGVDALPCRPVREAAGGVQGPCHQPRVHAQGPSTNLVLTLKAHVAKLEAEQGTTRPPAAGCGIKDLW